MMIAHSTILILIIALIVDRFIGDPDFLWQKFTHPIVYFGKAIEWADKKFNRASLSETMREKAGVAVIAFLMIAAIILGRIISSLLPHFGWGGFIVEVIIVAIFLAQKSLADHVRAVADGLRRDGLDGGREAVSMIVGRDPVKLDESGVCRAAIESLAENASDGVVAPAFWYAIFGLPGLFAYKMLNTADSMIGHKTAKYRAFGRASARFDDFANWVPARITGFLIVLSGGVSKFEENSKLMMRDAKLHRSPNAGWPESAMAAVLGLALGGPRVYKDDIADEPFMNEEGRAHADVEDIDAAINKFNIAMSIGLGLVVFCLIF